jgi:hypothetical protein
VLPGLKDFSAKSTKSAEGAGIWWIIVPVKSESSDTQG